MAKATQKFEQKLTGVTLELTVEEAQQIQALLGKTTGDVLYSAYMELDGTLEDAGEQANALDVFDGDERRVGILRVQERV